MRSVFTKLSKPELDFLTDNIIFNETDKKILILSTEKYSDIQIGNTVSLSPSMVTKRKRKIKQKIKDFLEVLEDMVTIRINGEKVSIDEIKKYDIQIDKMRNVIVKKLFGEDSREKEKLTKHQ